MSPRLPFLLSDIYLKILENSWLDNVVKEYSSATANIFTAVLSALLFPDKFEMTIFILLTMALLFTGIYLYEKKSFKSNSTEEEKSENETLNEQ